jgi:hypothetical protein
MFLKKLLRCRPYVHTDCHFRSTRASEKSESEQHISLLRILETSK